MQSKYTVTKNGQTLGQVSNEVYGTASRYMDIYNANKAMIDAANRANASRYPTALRDKWIWKGQQLTIPGVTPAPKPDITITPNQVESGPDAGLVIGILGTAAIGLAMWAKSRNNKKGK